MSDCYEGGEGAPLVLLHGLGGSWHIWQPVIPLLEKQCWLYVPTLPGHMGGAPWPAGQEPSIGNLADMLAEDFAARGINRPHIAGNSLGGWLALELAQRGVAASVTALSPAGSWPSLREYRALARQFRMVYRTMPVLIALTRPFLHFARIRRGLNAQVMKHGDRMPANEVLRAMCAMGGTRILPRLLRAMEQNGPIKSLDAGDIPVTIAWCEDDKAIPLATFGAVMYAAVPGASAVTVNGCGHVPMYDDPERVSGIILGTIAKVADKAH